MMNSYCNTVHHLLFHLIVHLWICFCTMVPVPWTFCRMLTGGVIICVNSLYLGACIDLFIYLDKFSNYRQWCRNTLDLCNCPFFPLPYISVTSFSRIASIISGKILPNYPWWLNGKESASQCRKHVFSPWTGKILWRRKWQPTPVFLPGEFHGQRSLVGCSPWNCRVGHNLATQPLSPPPATTTILTNVH